MKKKILIVSIIVLILDQICKLIVSLTLTLNKSVIIIKNFFNLTYVYNVGAAWSILENKRFLLIMIGIISLYIIYTFIKDYKETKINILAFGLLIGGILGNLVDRLFLGYVRDFLDFYIFGYNYPIFNVGDIGILLGVVLLIIESVRVDYGSKSRKKLKDR